MEDFIVKNKASNNIKIYNTIRRLGLRPNHSGTIFILKAIQMIQKQSDFIIMNNIYIELAKTNESFTASQIRVAIKYAIDNRNEKKSIDNFEEIFGYEYDEEIFTNKDFIEELSRTIERG
ncbi:MAG: sporulation initiation factor Spo0A C-terminal domain-containing protein [Candidatus Scatovivens sp.]